MPAIITPKLKSMRFLEMHLGFFKNIIVEGMSSSTAAPHKYRLYSKRNKRGIPVSTMPMPARIVISARQMLWHKLQELPMVERNAERPLNEFRIFALNGSADPACVLSAGFWAESSAL